MMSGVNGCIAVGPFDAVLGIAGNDVVDDDDVFRLVEPEAVSGIVGDGIVDDSGG